MRVKELQRLAELNKDKLVRIYNPDFEDFTVNYHGYPVTIKSMQIQKFNTDVANHIKKHLANQLMNKRGIKTNAEDTLSAIYKEIEVNYDEFTN